MQGPKSSEFVGRIVNKNSLETGRLVGIQSPSSVVTSLITNSTKHELLVMKGRPTSSTIITKHHSLNGNLTVTSDSDSVTLDISFSNDLPKGIYNVFDIRFSSSWNIKVFLYGECGGIVLYCIVLYCIVLYCISNSLKTLALTAGCWFS